MLSSDNWPQLAITEIYGLNRATEQVHRAVQFISMAGKFFLEHLPDESNTNMGWDMENRRLYGHTLPSGHRLSVHPESLTLQVIGEQNSVVAQLPLEEKTWEDGVEWVKKTFQTFGVDTSAYRMDIHYDIPDHEIHHGASFQTTSEMNFNAFSTARDIGDQVMKAWASPFEYATDVRSWPHHFDIGSYIPLTKDEAGETVKSITIGLAIQDAYVDEYYFYITHWNRDGEVSYEHLPELPASGYWNRKHFTGAFLKLSDLIQGSDTNKQIDKINRFMRAGILASMELLGINPEPYTL